MSETQKWIDRDSARIEHQETDKRIERLTDLVRYARHYLHEEKLISDVEFASLVADSENGQRVARLEGYDKALSALKADASWAATHRSELADLRVAFEKAERENAALRSDLTAARELQFSPMGDNHHNANLCPYCLAWSCQEAK